jgi:hypothetical protein
MSPPHGLRVASRRLTARASQVAASRPAPPTIDPPIDDSLARDVCLIERGMSWNDTASTEVELQSALQF